MRRRGASAKHMAAKRCPNCGTNWPPTIDYRRCPECEVETAGFTDAAAIDRTEAERRAKAADFERRYAAREAARIRRGDPTPEEIGAGEAHQILREIAKLERDLAE